MLEYMNEYTINVNGTVETDTTQKSFHMCKSYVADSERNAIMMAYDFIDGWMKELYEDDLVAINVSSIEILAIVHDLVVRNND